MNKYTVLKIAVLMGAVRAIGEVIEMPNDEAKVYLDAGFVKVADENVSAEKEAVLKAEAEKEAVLKAEAEKEAQAKAEAGKGK